MENLSPLWRDVFTVLAGFTASSVFLLVLLIGFCVAVGFSKLRKGGGNTMTVRNLEESMGATTEYLPPNAPRGPADQLETPELQEVAARKPV